RQTVQETLDAGEISSALVDGRQSSPPIRIEEVGLLGPVAWAVVIDLRAGDGVEAASRPQQPKLRMRGIEGELGVGKCSQRDSTLCIEQGRGEVGGAGFVANRVAQLRRAFVEGHPGGGLIEFLPSVRGLSQGRSSSGWTAVRVLSRFEMDEGNDSAP